MGDLSPAFRGAKEGSECPSFTISQVPLVQNNLYTKVAYLGDISYPSFTFEVSLAAVHHGLKILNDTFQEQQSTHFKFHAVLNTVMKSHVVPLHPA